MRIVLKIDLAKHGLNKTWDLRQIWSHFGRPNRREREGRGKERRRGRGREEEEKRRGKQGQRGMELTLGMNSSMDHMDFVWNSRKVYELQT